MTPEGQRQFLADVIKTVKEAPEGRGIGVNYWRPEETYIPNATGGRAGPDANSLFDAKGNPLPAMNVLGLQPMPRWHKPHPKVQGRLGKNNQTDIHGSTHFDFVLWSWQRWF